VEDLDRHVAHALADTPACSGAQPFVVVVACVRQECALAPIVLVAHGRIEAAGALRAVTVEVDDLVADQMQVHRPRLQHFVEPMELLAYGREATELREDLKRRHWGRRVTSAWVTELLATPLAALAHYL